MLRDLREVASLVVTSRLPLALVGRLVALVVVVLGFVVGVRACSVTVPERDELVSSLMTSGLSEAVAECSADALFENLSDKELRQLTERGGGGAPVDDPNRSDDSSDKVRDAMTKCREMFDHEAASSTTTTEP